jgi:hypothetical protein
LPRRPRCDRSPTRDFFAICTTNRSASSSIRGRPTRWRNFDPSNLLAMSFRYLSRLCGVEEIQSYVGTGACRACISEVRGICRDSFPDQVLPKGDSFKDSQAFQMSETFAELERNYKREAEIFFSEPRLSKRSSKRLKGFDLSFDPVVSEILNSCGRSLSCKHRSWYIRRRYKPKELHLGLRREFCEEGVCNPFRGQANPKIVQSAAEQRLRSRKSQPGKRSCASRKWFLLFGIFSCS